MGIRKFIKVNRDLVGQKNNLLTAISKIDKNGRWYWNCKCECGNITCLREDYFISGKTKSCGCYGSRNSIYKINQKPLGVSSKNSHFNSYKTCAKKRGIDFGLTKEEFEIITSQNCYYCNSEPRDLPYKNSNGIARANGIDRKDSDLGYIFKNCLPCCSSCNFMKGSLKYDDFIEKCNIISKLNKYRE